MSQQLLESVAVIPDGNRRFAKKNNLPLEAAYLAGFRKAGEFAQWAFDKDVKTVSYWALSLDNFAKRSQDELNVLFKLMTRNINDSLTDSRFKRDACRVKFFGKRELLPLSVQQGMAKLEEKTRDGNKTMNIAIAYSGREELLTASKNLAADIASGKINAGQINEETFSQYLYYPQSPQLIIRTGNVQRLSGFLPWQNSYSELYFSPKLWPEFNQQDFLVAKEFFETTEQRFGK
ncbi:MAG: polyprenyl diphosphate synthase [Candidatus Micrarchaeota archaeon]